MFKQMRKMQRKFDRMFGFDSPFGNGDSNDDFGDYRKAFADFREDEDEFIINVELPGIEKEDIKLDIVNQGIEIRAEKKKEVEKKEGKLFEHSKSFIGFSRYVALPENADLDKVDAIYKNGVLEVKVSKKMKGHNRKEVRIK